MKILNLLEGSEKLFHLTTVGRIGRIVRTGGLSCGHITGLEEQRLRKRLGITGKLFYLSMARSVTSIFIRDLLQSGNLVIFDIDGRRITKYGRVVPFNFFSSNSSNLDEMEDRLVGDHGVIPFNSGVYTRARVLVHNRKQVDVGNLRALGKYGFPVLVYSKQSDFLHGVNGKTVDEFFDENDTYKDPEDDLWVYSDGAGKYVQYFLKYAKGEKISESEAEYIISMKNNHGISFDEGGVRQFSQQHYDGVRKILIALRNHGWVGDNVSEICNRMVRAITRGVLDGSEFINLEKDG